MNSSPLTLRVYVIVPIFVQALAQRNFGYSFSFQAFPLVLFTLIVAFNCLLGFAYKEINKINKHLTLIGGSYALIVTMGDLIWLKIYSIFNIKIVLLIAVIGEV